ncbi:11210_t:CDS:2 [Rhizophagus irregularis]|nr:11210_t:CDS:2 [Rhizophagus irregularis]
MSKDGRIILAAGKWFYPTSEKEEIFKLFLDQEPIVKKDPKARKEPIKPTNVSPVTIPTVPQESINLQDYPPLQERRERLIEKLHN